jgi:hypothetical protein
MKKLWRVLRWVLAVVAGGLIIAQFFGRAKSNPAIDPSQTMESRLQVPLPVAAIFDRSCNDCHSNKTRWPWYSNVAPVSWFVIGHVNEGRQQMNFSEWGRYTPQDNDSLLRQICREVKAGDMPLSSYTPLHAGSKLSAEDVKTLCDWTSAERARIAAP